MIWCCLGTTFTLSFFFFFNHRCDSHTQEPESLRIQHGTCRTQDSDSPAHEAPWPFHPIILGPRWTCHMWHAPVLPLKKILKSFLSFLGGFFCLSLSDSSIAQAVPDLSGRCRGVKFIPFTIDSRGGAFILLGQQGALKLSVEIDARVGFPKLFLVRQRLGQPALEIAFLKQQKVSCDIRRFSNTRHDCCGNTYMHTICTKTINWTSVCSCSGLWHTRLPDTSVIQMNYKYFMSLNGVVSRASLSPLV